MKVRVVEDRSEAGSSVAVNSASCNKRRPRSAFGDQGTEADIEEADLSEEESDRKKRKPVANMSPTPDTALPIGCKPSVDEIDSPASQNTQNPKATSTPNDNSKRRKTEASSEDASFNS